MKRILCPIDFSEASDNAVQVAAEFAKQENAKLVLIHVLVREPRFLEIEEKVSEYEKRLQQEGVSFKVKIIETRTSLFYAIRTETKRKKYGLVIMGTNGADDNYQALFGSNSYQMIHKVEAPILIVPENCKTIQFGKILYATDYRNQDFGKIKKLIRLTEKYQPEITITHVNESETVFYKSIFAIIRASLEKNVEYPNLKFHQIVHEDVFLGLHNYVQGNKLDLLVLLTRKHTLFEKLFENQITKKITMAPQFPILIYKE